MSNNTKNLYHLDELSDYKVASKDSEVRGWEVKDTDKRVIGKVDRLLVNKETKRVVYLDVEVNESVIEKNHEVYDESAEDGAHEFINKDGENHIIIPIGMAHLDKENKAVFTNEINHNTFSKTKRFNKNEELNRDYEIKVYNHYFPEKKIDNTEQSDDKFYSREEFENPQDKN